VEMFVEPGLSYSKGRTNISVNLPIGYYRNRKPDPYTGSRGDATFPKYIALVNYSTRFGGLKLQRPLVPISRAQESTDTPASVRASADTSPMTSGVALNAGQAV